MRLRINQKKCIGCQKCMDACKEINNSSQPRIFISKNESTESFKITYCTMCGICEKVCPVKAIDRRKGVIDINPDACVGCKTCYYMCPFGAIEMISRQSTHYVKIIAQKCNLCEKNNFVAACAQACPTGAIEQAATISTE
ncbi:4Fe-4S dicluster domain-containing protein [Thermodesulfobium sp. 4217-1]|uniref:4Fe-4S dicluster domain-containing protein n=1 Tax=Thermodesulfobium sp. 4217-1 TaxID=3120013 RepID=UPI003221C16B